jgi:hypothetical protein
MAGEGRLTKEEWDGLEPLLAAADGAAHEKFMGSPEARALTDKTPGYLLLQHLKKLDDQTAIKLFRATEMYQHEITRADIGAAYLRGKKIGRAAAEGRESG